MTLAEALGDRAKHMKNLNGRLHTLFAEAPRKHLQKILAEGVRGRTMFRAAEQEETSLRGRSAEARGR